MTQMHVFDKEILEIKVYAAEIKTASENVFIFDGLMYNP